MWKGILALSALILAGSIGYYLVIYLPNSEKTININPPVKKISKLEEKVELVDKDGKSTGEKVTIREMYRRGLFDSIDTADRKDLTDDDIKAYCTNKTKKTVLSLDDISNASIDQVKDMMNITFRLCLSENDIPPYDLL